MPKDDGLPLTNAQRELVHQQRIKFELSPYEIQAVKAMREVKFGQLTFHFHNGVPLRYTFGASHNIDPTTINNDI